MILECSVHVNSSIKKCQHHGGQEWGIIWIGHTRPANEIGMQRDIHVSNYSCLSLCTWPNQKILSNVSTLLAFLG